MSEHEQQPTERAPSAEAMEALQNDARIENYPRMPGPDAGGDRREAWQTAIENIRRWCSEWKVDYTNLARRSGLSYRVVSEVLRGKYQGDTEGALQKMEAAVSAAVSREDAPSAGVQGFVLTAVAREIFAIVRTTNKLGRIGVLYEESGAGKSIALRVVMRKEFPNGLLIEANEGTASPVNFLRAMVRQIFKRSREQFRSRAEVFSFVTGCLVGSRRLIAVDEAENLTIDTLNVIRQVHDAAGVPIVLAGRPFLRKKIDRTMRDERIGGSLRGRICIECLLSARVGGPDGHGGRWLFSEDEVTEILSRYRVRFTVDAGRWLHALANLSSFGGQQCEQGALRYAVSVFEMAILLAKGQEITRETAIQANTLLRGGSFNPDLDPIIQERMRRARTAS